MNIPSSSILSKTPLTSKMRQALSIAVNGIFSDMQDLFPLCLDISEYSQRYLQGTLKNLQGNLFRYVCIIGGALSDSQKDLDDMVFIEYGGGTGFLSLLAKRIGIGTVIYNDNYDVSCEDAKEIARTLGCQADYYVHGGIDELVAFCDMHKIKCDCMASNDVLEHIYDVNDFCTKLHLLSHKGTTMVHASGANMLFYPYVKHTTREQIEAETINRPKQWGQKARGSLLAFSKEREKIIAQNASGLGDNETEQLASATRGLVREDIIKVVDRYLQDKQLPKPIEHKTNTCDPLTGSWAEHLMNPDYLAETLTFNGFDAYVLPLCWDNLIGSFIRKQAAKSLNIVGRLTRRPLYFSNGYAIHAKYQAYPRVAHQQHKYHMYNCRRSFIWWYLMLPFWELLGRASALSKGGLNLRWPWRKP